MVWVCYLSSSTCIAFVAALLRLLLFAVLCHLLLWWHKTTAGWFYPPEGGCFITPKGVVLTRGVVLFPKRGGCIPPVGGLTPLKVGIKPPRVVLRVVLSPIWGWFYARDQGGGGGGGLSLN